MGLLAEGPLAEPLVRRDPERAGAVQQCLQREVGEEPQHQHPEGAVHRAQLQEGVTLVRSVRSLWRGSAPTVKRAALLTASQGADSETGDDKSNSD